MGVAARFCTLFGCAAWLSAQSWGVRPPEILSRSEPAYTEEARRAFVNATIVAKLIVDESGLPRDVHVVHGAGFGLDENAVRAIQTWRFAPGVKEGKPQPFPTHVEIQFRLLNSVHEGQTVRLDFGLAPDVERPTLIGGEIPANPDPPAEAMLRIRFTVGRDGQPRDFILFETNNQAWADRALQQMGYWRFRPAMRAGQPEEVYAVLELTVQPDGSGNRAVLQRPRVPLLRAEPQDRSLAAPNPVSPPPAAMIEGPPRPVTCKWQASPGAASYLLEWDYMDRDTWQSEAAGGAATADEVDATQAAIDFAGAEFGRWRVWPVNARGERGNPSEWRTVRFQRSGGSGSAR